MTDVIEALVAMMLEDESWQGDLTDNERVALMNIARVRFRSVIAAERIRLRDLFRKVGPGLEGASSRASLFGDILEAFGL
ncbi:MAG: hypothetical protein EHM48_00070 [Planctomycetaceae bacterium]|nr:MAG: hypothetical protein EHM48_00070 [Planctomycetaceae bacterium]